ncbi:peptide chain release factor 2 [Desulfosoma caldarium]|uniref:Peptide chain release factor 2 n=1 Tax=Desulfosoma caldarium TaxID=610254 RepID=A0A3N1URC5_9BACT|nr:peptide chain release factor 2 [Desulfosoma caldarium]ROQ91117.1 peptide chain release factor 2 (bRF-2) [Desulfosoma caldarium]
MVIETTELRSTLKELHQRVDTLGGYLDIAGKRQRLQELDRVMARQDFWDDPEKSKTVLKERAQLSEIIVDFDGLKSELEDNELLLDLALEEGDGDTIHDVARKVKEIRKKIKALEVRQMLAGENDVRNAIVSINAGAGGTEAQDWAEMLLRMYLRWCERRGFQTEVVDLLEGEEAGIKSATFTVNGPYAYGLLKGESGVHRLVRISPFDASGRRHTSFAAVCVYPEVDDSIVIDIKPSDLQVETFRSSGAGGQHVNKTSSAVRITHLPTGIVVQCQNERSQHRNRDIAMKVLRARLYEREMQKKQAEMQELHDNLDEIAWGNQIRSYVLQPYRLVKDHRTQVEKGHVDSVLDGDLDDFVEAFLFHELQAQSPTPAASS